MTDDPALSGRLANRCNAICRWALPVVLSMFMLSGGAAELHGQAASNVDHREERDRFLKLYEARDYVQAEAAGQPLLRYLEATSPDNDRLLAAMLSLMGEVCFFQNTDEKDRLSDAYYRRSLEMQRQWPLTKETNIDESLQKYSMLKYRLGEYEAADALMDQALDVVRRTRGEISARYADLLHFTAAMQGFCGDHEVAIGKYRKALAIYDRVGYRDVVSTYNNLGIDYRILGDFIQAEACHRQALSLLARLGPKRYADLVLSHELLAGVYSSMRDEARADENFRVALDICGKSAGKESVAYAETLEMLARHHESSNRLADARRLFEEAIAIRRRCEAPQKYAYVLTELSTFYLKTRDVDAAERVANEAIKATQSTSGETYNDAVMALGTALWAKGQRSAARSMIARALATKRVQRGGNHPNYAAALDSLAQSLCDFGAEEEAIPYYEEAIKVLSARPYGTDFLSQIYFHDAQALWRLDRREEALKAITEAIRFAEVQRDKASASEQDRGQFFSGSQVLFERSIAWQVETDQAHQAFATAERGRARSLIDQLRAQGVQLLANVPAEIANMLRKRERQANRRIAALEKQLDLLLNRQDIPEEERKSGVERLNAELRAAREELIAAYRDIRAVSPSYRLAVGQDFQPTSASEVGKWIADHQALLLEYVIGDRESFVFILDGTSLGIEKLAITSTQARDSGIEAGPLTAAKLQSLWQVNEKSLPSLLSKPDIDESTIGRLALLWEVLIPADVRVLLTAQRYKHLFVVPDDALVNLPFETLVVGRGLPPRFLLDVGPPIASAPSASILLNLARRPTRSPNDDDHYPSAQPVLTVANPVYPRNRAVTNLNGDFEVSVPRSRYMTGAGTLSPLPHTELESKWVDSLFTRAQVAVADLRGVEATEGNVRDHVANRWLLHFACHGLVDQRYGNFFGALALTPGRSPANAGDDGFLTLPEVYSLPLSGCELAILSACQTNVGHQQRGEGLYGLSRGFLVAGAQRVIASNWLVDDEAAASLISYFCGALAQSRREQSVIDYAAALATAKRWVRSQPKWHSPYYWATFVLIGPN